LKYRNLISFLLAIGITSSYTMTAVHAEEMRSAASKHTQTDSDNQRIQLHPLPGFFRFSFDNASTSDNTQHMGLVGFNYFTDITPNLYGGVGIYGAVTGTQGGLFVLAVGGGWHHQFIPHWWGDIGFDAGAGGGKSAYAGGGLMLRPHIGIAYAWDWARLGLHYSYINFPSGQIHSRQIGLDFEIPAIFYYVSLNENRSWPFKLSDMHVPHGKFLDFERNDFAILLQAYRQQQGTLNTEGNRQDGTMGLVGVEFDHYFTNNCFWWLKAAGAFRGIPNGYMDILGGLGYHWSSGWYGLAFVPQFGVGAGGGGMVDTGGGLLINPLLGIELPLTARFSTRLSGGYLWAPNGRLKAIPITGELIYHLNMATLDVYPTHYLLDNLSIQGWRTQLLSQTYLHPQSNAHAARTSINLFAVQIDQLLTPMFFLSYQGAFAYRGDHSGGFATGMLGAGIQSLYFLHQRMQLFSEILVGAGGGGGLALAGGSLIEPVAGFRYAFNPIFGLQASVSQVKALRDRLNTTVLNLGVTIRFDTLTKE